MALPRFHVAGASTKLVGSLMAVGVSASMAGLGTYATFTDTETGSTAIDSGIVALTIGASGAANRLSVAAIDIVPGDTIERAVDLTVDSTTTSTLGSISLTTTATPSSLLDTDTTDGLQMAIDVCSVGWTESIPPYTYTCSGTTTSVVASRAVIGSDLALSGLGLAVGDTSHLRVRLTLPNSAGNTFQNLASTINYSFVGTQRAGANR